MLSDAFIRKASKREKAYKISDGRGLFLLVTTSGSKLWRFDYKFSDKRKTMALGVYPDVSLATARERHQAARTELANGSDPMAARQSEKAAPQTFEEVGRRWLEAQRPSWADRYYQLSKKRLEADVFPTLGQRPIAEIEPPELLEQIRKIEQRGAIETARRISNYCGGIFRFGIAEGVCKRDPSADIRDALKAKKPVKHRHAITENELPSFLHKLDTYDLEIDTYDAILLVLLTAGRTEEIRFSHSAEFEGLDTDSPLWRISAQRMKMQREHLVPLSRQAVDVVKRRIAMNPGGLLFARKTKSGSFSENTMLYALYRLGYHSRATVHGLRATFSTIAHEREFNTDWIELCLAHVDGGVRATYNSAKYLRQRRELLQWWADYIDTQRAAGKALALIA